MVPGPEVGGLKQGWRRGELRLGAGWSCQGRGLGTGSAAEILEVEQASEEKTDQFPYRDPISSRHMKRRVD